MRDQGRQFRRRLNSPGGHPVHRDRPRGEPGIGTGVEAPARSTPAINLVAASSGAGASDPGMALAAATLRAAGIEDALRRCGLAPTWDEVFSPTAGADRTVEMTAAAAAAATAVESSVRQGEPFLMLGGDHSLAAGSWSGVANALGHDQRFGLIWVDAHMDAHTPLTTHSGDGHGMPVASLLGEKVPAFAGLCRVPPAVRPENLCLIGSNSYEPEEAALLDRLGVRVFRAAEVHERGFGEVLADALAHLESVDRFGLSLDVDVINHEEAPGVVACKVHNPLWPGLKAADVIAGLRGLARHPGFIGMDLVELNPLHDIDDRTARLALALLQSLFAAP